MKLFFLIIFSFFGSELMSQTISGNLTLLANQEVKLFGFKGVNNYLISTSNINEEGYFQLNFTEEDYGVGYLITDDEQLLHVLLGNENVEIQGESISHNETIEIVKGQENQWFQKYSYEHPHREDALNAWTYLEDIYTSSPAFSAQEKMKQTIKKELERIKTEDKNFIESLPKDSYVRWFLPIRKFVSDVSVIAQHKREEIPATIQTFRNIDYADTRLYKSGLLKEAIDRHFWLIESSEASLDDVYKEMKISIDAMFEKLIFNEKILNEVTNHLFNLLERYSLFEASEYLALKVLNEVSCTINSDLSKQLETYRAMKRGNIAPDINFKTDLLIYSGLSKESFPEKLSLINSNFTLVVFGASWCPKCNDELLELSQMYSKFKEHGVEVVFISLDETEDDFRNFSQDFPFLSLTDLKKWDGSIVNDYYVFGTPTMFLLSREREIILRPIAVQQVEAWINWYLIGKK